MVEDEAGDAELVQQTLRAGGFDFAFKRVDSEDAFVKQLKNFRPGVILSDHGVCSFDGFSALSIAQGRCPDVPFIFVTGSLGEDIAAKALKSGAADFVLKHRMNALPASLHRALREARSQQQHKSAEQEIRRLNEELEHRVARRTAELEAANKELEAFSYSVSHELRAPLRHIEGFVEILRSEKAAQLDREAQRCLKSIATSSRRLGQLIDDLLAFSRTARAGMRIAKVNMKTLCEGAKRDLAAEMHGREVQWVVGDLPNIKGDAPLLRHVWMNLLGNALKYTRLQKRARIEISGRATDEELIFSVKDNGVGFDMRYAHKLFGVFQRLHPHSEFEGTGVGLATVQRIIHQHGGRTWAEGQPNKGATFYFTLPFLESGEH